MYTEDEFKKFNLLINHTDSVNRDRFGLTVFRSNESEYVAFICPMDASFHLYYEFTSVEDDPEWIKEILTSSPWFPIGIARTANEAIECLRVNVDRLDIADSGDAEEFLDEMIEVMQHLIDEEFDYFEESIEDDDFEFLV